MNAELDGLLEAIHEKPDDHARWLILADWLEEYDDPRRAALLRDVRALRAIEEGPERLPAENRVQALLRDGVTPCVPTRTNSIGMHLALIPAGVAWIGSPPYEVGRYDDETRRRVELTKPFYLGVHAVTQEQYQRVVGRNPSGFRSKGRMRKRVEGLNTSRFPVENVNFRDACTFCSSLGSLPEEQAAGRQYRLPSEIEWEFACRGEASQMAPFPYGMDVSANLVNFRTGRKRTDTLGRVAAVGSYPPNAFGLYEMVGNVWQWCADAFVLDAYDALPPRDPPIHNDGDRNNARGGTFDQEKRRVRTSDRSSFDTEHRDVDCGFRVLMEWTPPRRIPKANQE